MGWSLRKLRQGFFGRHVVFFRLSEFLHVVFAQPFGEQPKTALAVTPVIPECRCHLRLLVWHTNRLQSDLRPMHFWKQIPFNLVGDVDTSHRPDLQPFEVGAHEGDDFLFDGVDTESFREEIVECWQLSDGRAEYDCGSRHRPHDSPYRWPRGRNV